MIPLRWSPHHPLSLSHKSNLLPLYSTFFLRSAPEDWLYNGEQVISRVPCSFLPAPLRLNPLSPPACHSGDWNGCSVHPPLEGLHTSPAYRESMPTVLTPAKTIKNRPINTEFAKCQVQVVPGTRTEQCLSSSSISTFTDRQLAPAEGGPGVYTLYQHVGAQQEVQLSVRRCNLRALCHCSVAVRIQDLVIGFDICSKGYLQVWSRGAGLSKGLPEGADLVSLDEGRGYRVTMPTGTAVTLGPYLSTVQVDASSQDEGSVDGLCGKLGRRPRALSSHKDIFDEWRLVLKK